MSALRRLACLLFGHQPYAGLDARTCIRFHCARCGGTFPGFYGVRR